MPLLVPRLLDPVVFPPGPLQLLTALLGAHQDSAFDHAVAMCECNDPWARPALRLEVVEQRAGGARIVQAPQVILQHLQAGDGALQPLLREKVAEELAGVAQLLGADAQLVQLGPFQLRDAATALVQFFRAAAQLSSARPCAALAADGRSSAQRKCPAA